MKTKRAWLNNYSWELVESINRGFCESSNIVFKRFETGGYHKEGQTVRSTSHKNKQTLVEAVTLSNQLHQISPLHDYNGATFVMITRSAISEAEVFKSDREREIIRSAAGHVIAGTAHGDEMDCLLNFQRSPSDK